MLDVTSPYIVPLGVASALPDADHANSYLAVVHRGRYWLVDCAGGPIGRLQRAGLDPLAVQGIVITHMHPDHVFGLPIYLLGLFMLATMQEHTWAAPLPIHARAAVLPSVRALLMPFASQPWLSTLPLVYREVAPAVGAPVAETKDFVVTAAPTHHSEPSLAVRFARPASDRAFVYSSDTAPCEEVEALAQGATLLFHEATDSDRGHTRPAAAGALATRAGVGRLVLIHYRTDPESQAHLLAEARRTFEGPVQLAQALDVYPW